MTAGDPSLSAFPEGDNIFQWTGTITGGAGTVCCAERCFGAARTGAAAAAYAGSSPSLAAAAAAAGCRRCWLPPPPPPPPPLLPGYDTAATTMGGHQPLTMPTVAAAAAMRTPCVLVPCSCRTQPAAPPALLATMRADLASLPAIRSQVYEGLTFKLLLKFPTSYPFEAPQVTFSTPCFHPNVDQYGNICLGAQPSEALPPPPHPPGAVQRACPQPAAHACAGIVPRRALRYSEGEVERGVQRAHHPPLHSEPARRPQPGQSAQRPRRLHLAQRARV